MFNLFSNFFAGHFGPSGEPGLLLTNRTIKVELKNKLKFAFSKKATKIDKIFTVDLKLTT